MGDKPVVVSAREGTGWQLAGVTSLDKLEGQQTSDRLSLSLGEIPPGLHTMSHIHRKSSETFYVLSGSLIVDIDEEEVRLDAGDMAYVPPLSRHRLSNEGQDPARVLYLFAPAGPELGERKALELMSRSGHPPTSEELNAVFAECDTVDFGPPRPAASG